LPADIDLLGDFLNAMANAAEPPVWLTPAEILLLAKRENEQSRPELLESLQAIGPCEGCAPDLKAFEHWLDQHKGLQANTYALVRSSERAGAWGVVAAFEDTFLIFSDDRKVKAIGAGEELLETLQGDGEGRP
jgi:hypothetical protein